MRTRIFAFLILFAGFLFVGANAMAADATPEQVYQAAQAGNFREAQGMMDQILRDHPNSAKAHFVEAELLAKQGKPALAQAALDTALRLEPDQSFARPGAVQELQSAIASGYHARDTSHGFPWGLILAAVVAIALITMFMRTRRGAVYAGSGMGSPAYPGTQYGNQPGYGYGYRGPAGYGPTGGGGIGSGILGGLATGAAVGAGVVAGEALMNRVLDGGSSGISNAGGNIVDPAGQPDVNVQDNNYDMGGNDFGLRDAGSWDDNAGGGGDAWDTGGSWDTDTSSGDDWT